jgi:protein-S-isoprenylcysteine O-methyltransferase Ste14
MFFPHQPVANQHADLTMGGRQVTGEDRGMLLFKNLLFAVIAPGTAGVYLPLWLARNHSVASGSVFLLALPLLLLGGVLYAWCVWDFATVGRGTPAVFDAPKQLVVRGPYRQVRNPMYLSILMLILGWAVMFQFLALCWYALCLGLAFHLFVVLYEEPRLGRRFGTEYPEYCAKVDRWWPRFRRQSAP